MRTRDYLINSSCGISCVPHDFSDPFDNRAAQASLRRRPPHSRVVAIERASRNFGLPGEAKRWGNCQPRPVALAYLNLTSSHHEVRIKLECAASIISDQLVY